MRTVAIAVLGVLVAAMLAMFGLLMLDEPEESYP